MTIADQICDALLDFADQLERGEPIEADRLMIDENGEIVREKIVLNPDGERP